MSKIAVIFLCLGMIGCVGCAAFDGDARRNREGEPKIEGTRTEVYKTVGATQLALTVFEDPKSKEKKLRPAIVFFFGGGWSSGSPKQFEAQSRYLASRGMVAITADYRVRSRHQSRVIDSIADARSAMRWVRANSERLGIDPNRIAAGGGSAGGHLAASTAFISEFDDSSEDKRTSAVPNALILFNPAVILAELPEYSFNSLRGVPGQAFLGAEASRVSPAHHIKSGGPPTIIFHGRADSTVPYESAEVFSKMMKAEGNQCKLIGYSGQGHGFFNENPWMTKTLISADEFLGSLGWLNGPPTLTEAK